VETTEYSRLAGHKFPRGEYTLQGHVAWLWSDSIMAEPSTEVMNPTLGHYVALHGAGVSIGEIIELMGGDPATGGGSMLGRVEVEFSGALRVGTTYLIESEIVKVDRKRGKRVGPFDRLEFVARVNEKESGQQVLESTNTWVFIRKEEQ
jgi:hypothetical protein